MLDDNLHNKNCIKLLFSSDFHFGKVGMDQQDMAEAFGAAFLPLLADTDVVFLNGDFFDTLVIFDNHGFAPIYDAILVLFKMCQKYNVALRILQGTWEHDRSQCRHFETFYRNGHFTFDFRFWDTIALEEIVLKDRVLKVLYIPDDLPYKSSDDIVEVVQEKLLELGWETIDYGCLHGFFDFTFPQNISQDNRIVYKESQFPFITKMIDVGHVHQFRIQGKVASNGSFDRTVFGDEDPKGCIRVLDYPDHYTAQFIENIYAARFDTLTIVKADTTETIRDKITNHIAGVVTQRPLYLRFVVEAADHQAAIKEFMKEVYPKVNIKFKKTKGDEGQIFSLPPSDLLVNIEKRIAPTPKTIATFIRNQIPEGYDISIDQIETYLAPA